MKRALPVKIRKLLDEHYLQIRINRPLPSPEAEWTAIEKLINLCLRWGIPPLDIADQLIGIKSLEGVSLNTPQPHHIGEWLLQISRDT